MISVRCPYDKLANPKELKPHPKNPNSHDDEQIERLSEILKYQGWRYPIKVSNQSGYITSGHGRVLAALQLQLPTVPISYQDYETEDQEYADLIADNAIASWSILDRAQIELEIKNLPTDFNLDLLGLKDLDLGDNEGKCDEDEVPEKVEPKSKLGDLYKLGDHRLLCGDSTLIDSVQKLMSGHQADLVVTDPPYNVSVNDPDQNQGRNRRKNFLTIANYKMSDEDFEQFLISVFTNYFSALKEGSSIYVFYSDSMTIPFLTTFSKAGFHFAQNCIWNKQQFVMTRKDYHYKHEPVMYGWKQGQAHNWYSDRKQVSVWNFDRPFKNELHPTMKPIDLIEYPILNSSNKGDIVLDLFGGSGSTMIACEKTNRKCFSMELDPHYCDVIVARWENYTGLKAELHNG
jgi:DNA modification methylase